MPQAATGTVTITPSARDPVNLIHIDVVWPPHDKGDTTRAGALDIARAILRELSDMPPDAINAIRLRV